MSEQRICQNCKSGFTIEPEDSDFYKKLDVPPPTWCPECRMIRRMCFRNERTLYKRHCDASGHGEEMISVFSPDSPQRVYCHKSWWGDDWDALAYGRNYDFSRNFFEQFKELWQAVPDIGLFNINPVNSDYCSITEGNKNCYLVIGGDFNENCAYSAFNFHCQECLDCYWISKCEWNYETVDCISCSRLRHSRYSEGCYNSAFLFNCRNCHDCFMCANLNNGAYQILNQQYSKEEYQRKIGEYDLTSRQVVAELKAKFREHTLKYPRRFARLLRSVNSTGDNVEESKNCRACFDVFGGAEDCRYLWLTYSQVKNCYDIDHSGMQSQEACDDSTIYPGNQVFYSRFIFNSQNIFYSYNCHNCSNCFGCVGLRNKKYCVFNRQYNEDEYRELVAKIRNHMDQLSYQSKVNGQRSIVYKYGEFFPPDISPFGYNETVAQELFPKNAAEVKQMGGRWQEGTTRNYRVTISHRELPDRIADISEDISKQVISCEHEGKCQDQCATAFRVTPEEFRFYQNFGVPVPSLCPNCRHYARLKQRNPMKLWHRRCMCGGRSKRLHITPSQDVATSCEGVICQNTTRHFHGAEPCLNEFETSYAPDRPEIVYCEQCYQAEVA
ncbi:MAG: hypothetical protein HY978_02675 [Candidatus Liptonbacteria bacterium]|nr:hypothetical protein [Candidatus Liptonbacteria bacterium]